MYRLLLDRGEAYYTDLDKMFRSIPALYSNYNWSVSDFTCNQTEWYSALRIKDSCSGFLITGDRFRDLLASQKIQWIWGVFSGVPKETPFSQFCIQQKPYADGNQNLWTTPLKMQHPLAEVEIVAWDGVLTMVLTEDFALVQKFQQVYPDINLLEIPTQTVPEGWY